MRRGSTIPSTVYRFGLFFSLSIIVFLIFFYYLHQIPGSFSHMHDWAGSEIDGRRESGN